MLKKILLSGMIRLCGFFCAVRVVFVAAALFPLAAAWGLVYCATNAADVHQVAPTGALANSGWHQTVPLDLYLATVIASNALLTAGHIVEITLEDSFFYEGTNHTLTAKADDPESDLAVYFFTPPVTNFARLHIETNDIGARVVLQGRGLERGAEVLSQGGLTNGWKWDWDRPWSIRRWGVNRYDGTYPGFPTYAVAAFDNNGDPDECMLSLGDSGGPGFVQTGSGWKLATVNYSVGPVTFTYSTNDVDAFAASLYDYTGLYYDDDGTWRYASPQEPPAPLPCRMINTRVSQRIAWLTNTVTGITFPADVGVVFLCETNRPSGSAAADGLRFEVIATNAGPYTARNLALDLAWHTGLRPCGFTATQGSFVTNRWSLPSLEDGGCATLRVDAVVWRAAGGWGTNRVSITASDKPDEVASNDTARCVVFLPATATLLRVE